VALVFRAFRGTRRSSVYREHVVPADALAAIREAAAAARLPLLAYLDECELDKDDAKELADEATALRAEATLLELDAELTAIAEVANWCAHARGGSWLRIGASGDDVAEGAG
jgi:hypothetical protein